MNKENIIEVIDNDNRLFKLYTLAELSYQKHFENKIEDKELLYPEGWYSNQNYNLKIDIIAEAISKNILIEYTVKYQELIEGIKRIKKN